MKLHHPECGWKYQEIPRSELLRFAHMYTHTHISNAKAHDRTQEMQEVEENFKGFLQSMIISKREERKKGVCYRQMLTEREGTKAGSRHMIQQLHSRAYIQRKL